MRPILLVFALLLAFAAPHAAQAQYYYPSTPYTVSYAPAYSASYAPTYVAYAPVVSATATTAYYATPQATCAYSTPAGTQVSYRPITEGVRVPNVNGLAPVQSYYPEQRTRTVTSRSQEYNVFTSAGEIYAANSSGRLWILRGQVWNEFAKPIDDN